MADTDLKRMSKTRILGKDMLGTFRISLPPEVAIWFGWKPGDNLRCLMDIKNQRVILENSRPEPVN